MATIEQKTSVSSLKVNMVIARDILTRSGMVLVAKDTMLNKSIIERLKESGVHYVFTKVVDYTSGESDNLRNLINASGLGVKKAAPVKDSVLDEAAQKEEAARQEAAKERSLPVEQRKEFSEFKEEHHKKEEEVKDSIREIGNGGVVDMTQLYSITDNIMNSLDFKSDIFAYLGFLKTKDDHTFSHSLNVSLLCNLFGRWLGFNYDELIRLTVAGILHDIGKTQIDLTILNKPGKLTPEEYGIMKQHTVYGYKMIKSQRISEEVKSAALMHHEKIDGTGYPCGLTGDKISDYAKIVAVCDIYDAMTANRAYREKLPPFEVIRTFEQRSYGALDGKFVQIFLTNIAYTYVSSSVSLSNGQIGEIVFINPSNLSRPIVRVGEKYIDLSQDLAIDIVSMT